MDARQEHEWCRAQFINFTAQDLVTAAKEQIFFLQSVDSCYPSLYQGPLLLAAVRRYVKYWLPLLAELDGYSASWIPLVPPLECGWIWHCHRLNPVAYEKDCQRLFGRVLDPPFVDPSMKEIAVDGSAYIWNKRYPGHPYQLDPKDYLGLSDADVCCEETPFEVELEQAVYNQKLFYHQVCLAILDGRHIPIKSDQNLFVRAKLLRKWADFKVDTIEKSNSTNTINWKQSWIMECEIDTNGLTLELRSRPKSFMMGKVQGSKLIGSSILEWQKMLESPMLHLNKWVVAIPLDFPKNQNDAQPMFHVVASSTPTQVGPYLLKMVHAIPTDDNGETLQPGFQQRGGWISRTIIDHARDEIFVVRIKYFEGVLYPQLVPENEKVIYIHRGGWRYSNHYPIETKHGIVPGEIIGSAQQLTSSNCDQYILHSMRQWSLFNGDATLTISRTFQFIEIQGNLGYPLKLYRGRRLQYQVKEGSNNDDMSFVTIVRFFPNAPLGKATALFNWKTGEVEVTQEENVALVILLMATIGISMYDMIGDVIGEKPKHQKSTTLDTNEMGCLVVNKRYWYTKNIEETHDMILGGMIREDQRTMKQRNYPNDTNSSEGNASDHIETTFGLIGATLEFISNIMDS